jgi:histone H3/H4
MEEDMLEGSKNYWSILQDSANKMDVSQITYVMAQEPVKESYESMMKAFNSYIFEKFKEDFSAVPAYQPTINNYVSSVIEASKNYAEHATHLEEENNKLKKELEELRNASRSQTE